MYPPYPPWTAKQAKNSYEAYLKLYKETKSKSEKTGFGVTEDDLENGVRTIEDKLDVSINVRKCVLTSGIWIISTRGDEILIRLTLSSPLSSEKDW
jgi:hypothetical protein